MPFTWLKQFMIGLAITNLAMTVLCYIFCIIVFGGINNSHEMRRLCFAFLSIKAALMTPFIGLEYYDTMFEHIYHDVQF